MVDDLIPSSAAATAPASEVPHWLIKSQREHIQTAGVNEPPRQNPSSQKRPRAKTSHRDDSHNSNLTHSSVEGPSAAASSIAEDDDLIMLDLLDGAHLPTRQSPPTASNQSQARISSHTDSIISLPPADDRINSRWQTLQKQAQENRRLTRGGHSVGPGNLPPYMKAARLRPPNPSATAPPEPLTEDLLHPPPQLRPSHLPDRTPDRSKYAASSSKNPEAFPSSETPPIPASRARRDFKTLPREHDLLAMHEQQALEIQPLLSEHGRNDRVHRAGGSSFSIARDIFLVDDSSVGESARSGGKRQRRHRKNRRYDSGSFRPSVWGWRMPAEEDAIMPHAAWIYLPLIGWLTFMIAIAVNSSASFLSKNGIGALGKLVHEAFGKQAEMWLVALLRGAALAISFLLVLFIAPQYSAGSGIPEMKCVLSGVLMPRMLNWQTLFAKMVGLVFALTSNISIGRLGPFIHMSGITAALVSKIPFFTTLRSSARFQLQALSAAMAAGVGATFGAPIGGTMLSIEVMSTYYYIHWLPMAFYCSIMGYFFVISIVNVDSRSFFPTDVTVQLELHSSKRLLTYILLGVTCGVVGAALVQFTKGCFLVRRRYFTNATPARTTVMVAVFAILHTLVTTWVGGVLRLEGKEGVVEVFNANHKTSAGNWLKHSWEPFEYEQWNAALALSIAMLIKFVLTGFSLVMPVPAGTFMPIFEVGALLGRAFGEICAGFSFVDWVDPRATAIIGAAALTAGTLHTTSIAVVMLELTREALDVLPLAVGVLVSYGVSKQLCSDLFSELIKIRRLPFILGLRERYPSENKRFYEDVSSVVAGSFMSRDFAFVTPSTTKGEVHKLLTGGGRPWINCAVLSDETNRRLWGTVSQQSLWDALGEEFLQGGGSDDEVPGYGSVDGIKEARRAHAELQTVPFLRNFDPSVGSRLIDMGPMQISIHTPFWKIITLFRMLSMSTMYVMKDGVTVGCVSKAQVISYSIDIEDLADRKRKREKEIVQEEKMREREHKEYVRRLKDQPVPFNRLASQLSEKDLHIGGGRRSRQGSRHGSRQGSMNFV